MKGVVFTKKFGEITLIYELTADDHMLGELL